MKQTFISYVCMHHKGNKIVSFKLLLNRNINTSITKNTILNSKFSSIFSKKFYLSKVYDSCQLKSLTSLTCTFHSDRQIRYYDLKWNSLMENPSCFHVTREDLKLALHGIELQHTYCIAPCQSDICQPVLPWQRSEAAFLLPLIFLLQSWEHQAHQRKVHSVFF